MPAPPRSMPRVHWLRRLRSESASVRRAARVTWHKSVAPRPRPLQRVAAAMATLSFPRAGSGCRQSTVFEGGTWMKATGSRAALLRGSARKRRGRSHAGNAQTLSSQTWAGRLGSVRTGAATQGLAAVVAAARSARSSMPFFRRTEAAFAHRRAGAAEPNHSRTTSSRTRRRKTSRTPRRRQAAAAWTLRGCRVDSWSPSASRRSRRRKPRGGTHGFCRSFLDTFPGSSRRSWLCSNRGSRCSFGKLTRRHRRRRWV
mmetsp:Transcript_1286/g.5152  ORF Transcript_1286/g.5152 Transcript_1286/m.5152 type:complete len:257 (-) Transcript_1286:283-1053(-)